MSLSCANFAIADSRLRRGGFAARTLGGDGVVGSLCKCTSMSPSPSPSLGGAIAGRVACDVADVVARCTVLVVSFRNSKSDKSRYPGHVWPIRTHCPHTGTALSHYVRFVSPLLKQKKIKIKATYPPFSSPAVTAVRGRLTTVDHFPLKKILFYKFCDSLE